MQRLMIIMNAYNALLIYQPSLNYILCYQYFMPLGVILNNFFFLILLVVTLTLNTIISISPSR